MRIPSCPSYIPNFPNCGTEFTDAALQEPVTKPILNGFSLVILSLERTRT